MAGKSIYLNWTNWPVACRQFESKDSTQLYQAFYAAIAFVHTKMQRKQLKAAAMHLNQFYL